MTSAQSSARVSARSGVQHVRHRHAERFTVVGNHLAQNRRLSLVAIGIAVHIQSLPDGVPVGIRELTARFHEGEVAIARALRELEAEGYLERERLRLPDGRMVTRTTYFERPGAAPAAVRKTTPRTDRARRAGRFRRTGQAAAAGRADGAVGALRTAARARREYVAAARGHPGPDLGDALRLAVERRDLQPGAAGGMAAQGADAARTADRTARSRRTAPGARTAGSDAVLPGMRSRLQGTGAGVLPRLPGGGSRRLASSLSAGKSSPI